MFYGLENTQPEVSIALEELINAKQFPSACIFTGPSCCGKMYAALCCAKAFYADIDSTVILSDRNNGFRISAALKLYSKSKNKASKEFLIETVSTFLKQFHGALLDSSSPANRKKFAEAGNCTDLLDEISKASEEDAPVLCEKLEKALSSIVELNKAINSSRSSAVSVSQIRDIRDWCMESSISGKAKFIIIEGLENSLASASNALLKILEEPPLYTNFILLSSNPGRIPATILSRVRKFDFNSFTKKEKDFVLNRLFINPNDYSDLDSFFLKFSGVNDDLLRDEAVKLVDKKPLNLPELVSELEKSQMWDRFFFFVTEALRNKIFVSEDPRRYDFVLKEVEDIVSKGKSFNQNKRMTFDFVVYRSQEVLG